MFAYGFEYVGQTNFLPLCTPASMAPPDTNTDGILRQTAAINMPGTTLSQFGMNTIASNGLALNR